MNLSNTSTRKIFILYYCNCHYVDKNNRKTQEKFICKCCDKKLNADVNASRNIVARRSSNIEIYLKRESVLNILTNKFAENIKRLPRLYSKATTLINSNPYFKDRQIRINKVKLKYCIIQKVT